MIDLEPGQFYWLVGGKSAYYLAMVTEVSALEIHTIELDGDLRLRRYKRRRKDFQALTTKIEAEPITELLAKRNFLGEGDDEIPTGW